MIPSDANYDQLSRIVNDTYQKNQSIRQTARETGLSFDEVFEFCGYKDLVDFKETKWKD